MINKLAITTLDFSRQGCEDLDTLWKQFIAGEFVTEHGGIETEPIEQDNAAELINAHTSRIIQLLRENLEFFQGKNDQPLRMIINIPPGLIINDSEIFEYIDAKDPAVNHVEFVHGDFQDALISCSNKLAEDSSDILLISIFLQVPGDYAPTRNLGAAAFYLSKVRDGLKPVDSVTLEIDADSGKSNREMALDHTNQIYQTLKSIFEVSHQIKLNRKFGGNQEGAIDQPFKIRPWFIQGDSSHRHTALINFANPDIWVRESNQKILCNRSRFFNFNARLLPIQFNSVESGMEKIDDALNSIKQENDFAAHFENSMKDFTSQVNSKYTLSIIGESRQEIIKELERAREGIQKSIEKETDWQTPSGSFFTAVPLGTDAKVSFVYPGAFSTYIGMGNEIFFLFPDLYKKLSEITENPADTINKEIIYPNISKPEELEMLQQDLNSNPIQMITSGVCFSYLFTIIMRDHFGVQPQNAFGYSLGENSMMFALGVWGQAEGMRTSLEVSPIFRTRVSGPQNAIREYWHMPKQSDNADENPIWANYVLMAPLEKVKEAIHGNNQVFITHINAPRQVVIGGEKTACQNINKTLNCMHLQAPYHHAIHCDPIASEYEGLRRLHDWPVENQPDIPVYSAANYAPLKYDSSKIADSFATMLTNPIDFPRLVNLAYLDGARIFIELGAGSNCTKWIDAILKGKPHAAASINQVNISDHLSILRVLARLISHQVPVNLDPIWNKAG